jgi:hypothetical protein
MPHYIVETYLGRGDDFVAAAALAGAAATGFGVTHLRSTFIDEDEICLHWFEAPSLEAVREAASRAELECDRIVAASTEERKDEQ